MLLETLPIELRDMIADAACKVRSNGKTASNLRIVIRTQVLPSLCHDAAIQWVLRCLEDRRLEYAKEFGHYPWHVVSNVVHEESAPKHTDDGILLKPPIYPELVVAIHIGQVRDAYSNHGCDDDRLIVLHENPPCPELEINADVFKDVVKDVPPPPFITALGISAVSDAFMMTLWGEIISEAPKTHDGKGRGYMIHPMWMRMPDAQWVCVRERSFNFGWVPFYSAAYPSN